MPTTIINQPIIFSPGDSSWEDWNGSFLQFFGEEPISYNTEENWLDTPYSILSLTTFANYGLQDPSIYNTWQEWAESLISAVNGPTR
jgi:hypothetical protein